MAILVCYIFGHAFHEWTALSSLVPSWQLLIAQFLTSPQLFLLWSFHNNFHGVLFWILCFKGRIKPLPDKSSIPRGTNETQGYWNDLCSHSPKPRTHYTTRVYYEPRLFWIHNWQKNKEYSTISVSKEEVQGKKVTIDGSVCETYGYINSLISSLTCKK